MKPRIQITRLLSSSLLAAFLAAVAAACGSDRPVSTAAASCTPTPLHYHIAVDRSGSMVRAWDTVVAAVDTAIRRVPDGALLHVYTFADDVRLAGPWQIDQSDLDPVVFGLREVMVKPPSSGRTFIYSMADTLAARLRAAPAAKHVVFFVSDDDDDAPGYPDSTRARVRKDWAALGGRIPSSVRVVAVRLGDSSSFRSMVPGVAATPVSAIPDLGATIAREIENDPFARQRKRERREPLLSARLVPDTQHIAYPLGGDVKIAITSTAECGSYRLADGTVVAPGRTVVIERHLASSLSLWEGVVGRVSRVASASTAVSPGQPDLRVIGYTPISGASSSDTAYAGSGVALKIDSGTVRFTPMHWVYLVAAGLIAALVLYLLRWLGAPPVGGFLRPTQALDPLQPRIAVKGAHIPPGLALGPPSGQVPVTVQVHRLSRLRSRRKKVLTIKVVGDEQVGVATRTSATGGYRVTRVSPERPGRLDASGYIIWPLEDTGELPDRIEEGMQDSYPGYAWVPQARRR